MPPQVAAPEATLNPTKLKMASTTMAMPISMLNNTSNSGAMFGKISLHRICMGFKPMVTAEVT